jgi:hypothetical protein
MKLVKLIVVIAFTGMMFSCVAAVVNAPHTANSYRPGVSCSMLQSSNGSGQTTTLDCN